MTDTASVPARVRPPWKSVPITRPASCHGCREPFKIWSATSEGEYVRTYRHPTTLKWIRFHDECWPEDDNSPTDEGAAKAIAGEITYLLEQLAACDNAGNMLGLISGEVGDWIESVRSDMSDDKHDPKPTFKPRPRRPSAVASRAD